MIYKKYENSNSSSADVYRGVAGRNCSTDFLPDAKYLSMVEKSAVADILCKAANIGSC